MKVPLSEKFVLVRVEDHHSFLTALREELTATVAALWLPEIAEMGGCPSASVFDDKNVSLRGRDNSS